MDLETLEYRFPDFDDLPSIEGQPQGCLWGFFDGKGKKDELGSQSPESQDFFVDQRACIALNLLTPKVVREAVQEINWGLHVQLDWSMSNLDHPGFGRIPLRQTIKDLSSEGFVGFDDEIHINTQTSSQWDSLKHFGIQEQGLFYNGLTLEDARKSVRNGMHNICERGGIVGRGVLVDWLAWWEHEHPNEPAPSAITTHRITVAELEKVLEHQNTTLRQGDILIVRSGFVRWHQNADAATRKLGTHDQHHMIGVENSMETVRWLYSKHFSAVTGDTMGFEAWPYPSDCCLHEWLLCQWGTPIGELWNLEQLSATCTSLKKWTFLLTSAPLNVRGGVGSPPCAIAIL